MQARAPRRFYGLGQGLGAGGAVSAQGPPSAQAVERALRAPAVVGSPAGHRAACSAAAVR